jgi:5-hydroxyisourate hydrolase
VSAVTTHVLDTGSGQPAAGVRVRLELRDDDPAAGSPAGGWRRLSAAATDDDGRVRELGPDRLPPGTYRLVFDTGSWYADRGVTAFHPEVTVAFTVTDEEHLHVPLLLAPFAYSTYRGS